MVDTDVDRYPRFSETLSRILEDEDISQMQVERIEINLFASGDATYRVWAPKAEDPEGGYLARRES
jgi:hypothetical protein